MDASRFDAISKLFADRRLSRRQALAGGAGLAAAAVAGVGVTQTAAQAATPDVTPGVTAEVGPTMLFIQSFDSGSVVPAPSQDGRYILSLEHGLGQTLYFSDRPDRIVGANPTQRFLDGLGFQDDNPPNAALLVDDGEGGVNIAVIELFNPVYDVAGANLTYDVAVLSDYERALEMAVTEEPSDLSGLASSFGAAHLFIDDCPDGTINCSASFQQVGTFGNQGHCYSWAEARCLPCVNWTPDLSDAQAAWNTLCNNTFPACGGICEAYGVCTEGFC